MVYLRTVAAHSIVPRTARQLDSKTTEPTPHQVKVVGDVLQYVQCSMYTCRYMYDVCMYHLLMHMLMGICRQLTSTCYLQQNILLNSFLPSLSFPIARSLARRSVRLCSYIIVVLYSICMSLHSTYLAGTSSTQQTSLEYTRVPTHIRVVPISKYQLYIPGKNEAHSNVAAQSYMLEREKEKKKKHPDESKKSHFPLVYCIDIFLVIPNMKEGRKHRLGTCVKHGILILYRVFTLQQSTNGSQNGEKLQF